MSKGNRTPGPRSGRPRLKKSELSIMTSMRLGRATKSEIAQMAKQWRCYKTAVVERAVNEAYGRELFGQLYISPLNPAHPRHDPMHAEARPISVVQPSILPA